MRSYLEKGIILNNYTVIDVMGEGASCVAYSCKDLSGRRVVIKEYNPISIALRRDKKNYLICAEKDVARFNKGLIAFKESIQRQIQIRSGNPSESPQINNQVFDVSDQFESNGTYYYVMTEFSGTVFTKNSTISLYDRIRICKAIAQYVNACHNAGYLCLDIKPDNIYVLSETPELPLFFDYDSVIRKEDVAIGHILSCSEKWAAPEQLISGEYNKICEATDIYALGELLFWSVFDRNSYDEEHRSFSSYSFEKSPFSTKLDRVTRRELSAIFKHTIRSSVKKRYQKAADFIEAIDSLIKYLNPNAPRIISNIPPSLSHFVGREEDLLRIDRVLSEKHLAVLSGLGGIGKSEVVKEYCSATEKYDYIVFMSYGTGIVSTIVYSHFVSGIERMPEENEYDYCNRKIDLLSELCTNRTLLVIDNLNEEIENMENKEVFSRLTALSSDLLLTTRFNQETYKEFQIKVDGLDKDHLKSLYYTNSPYDREQETSVEEIINVLQNHTLSLELVSKLARNACLTPTQMLENMKKHGVLRSATEKVKLGKCLTIEEHIQNLFEFSSITEDQLMLLYSLSLMPVDGIEASFFCEFFSIDDRDGLRDLIDKGWVIEQLSPYQTVRVHAIIAHLAVAQINKTQKDSNRFLKIVYERLAEWSYLKEGQPEKLLSIFESIANQILMYGSRILFSANFLTALAIKVGIFISEELEYKSIKNATETYDLIYGNMYAIPREIAYSHYMSVSTLESRELIKIMYEHLESAKKADNCRWIIDWNSWLEEFGELKDRTQKRIDVKANRSYTRAVCHFLDNYKGRASKKKYVESFVYSFDSRKKCSFECDFPTWVLDDFGFFDKRSRLPIAYAFFTHYMPLLAYGTLKDSYILDYPIEVWFTKRTSGSFYSGLYSAVHHVLKNEYSLAISAFKSFLDKYCSEEVRDSKTQYIVRLSLGKAYLLDSQYDLAIKEFRCCSLMEKKLYPGMIEAHLLLCLAYIKSDRLILSYTANSGGEFGWKCAYRDIDEAERQDLASALFDKECQDSSLLRSVIRMKLYLVTLEKYNFDKNSSEYSDMKYLFHTEFNNSVAQIKKNQSSNVRNVYDAILSKQFAELEWIEGNRHEAIESMETARYRFVLSLGKKHPLSIECTNKLEIYKNSTSED